MYDYEASYRSVIFVTMFKVCAIALSSESVYLCLEFVGQNCIICYYPLEGLGLKSHTKALNNAANYA
jgi:Zn-finger protein